VDFKERRDMIDMREYVTDFIDDLRFDIMDCVAICEQCERLFQKKGCEDCKLKNMFKE
jgi:hypothetical protein